MTETVNSEAFGDRHVGHILRLAGGDEIRTMRTNDPEMPWAAVNRKIDENGLEISEVYPWVDIEELPEGSSGRFVIRIYQKTKDALHDHPKSAFVAAGAIIGLATSVVVLRKKRNH